MYKTVQEFTFTIGHNDSLFDFTGQLIFQAKELNPMGTLHTQDELDTFGALLNESLPIPEIWTLELMAEYLFTYAKPVFPNLFSVNLRLTESPQRVAEYTHDYAGVDGEILESEAIN